MGTRPPVLVMVVAASIVLVAAVAVWYPQRAVAIVVRPERTVYLPGESVNFTLVLKVEGNRPVMVWDFIGPPCGNFYYAVEDEGGRTIYPGVGGNYQIPCPMMMARLLQPGDTLSWNATWNQVNDTGFPVPAGHRYGIVGAFMERGEPVHVLAAPIWVFVKPA
jgi:hypothetical protein